MDRGDSPSRIPGRRGLCPSRTHGMSVAEVHTDGRVLTRAVSFNRLDLPAYDNFQDLQQKLMIAVEETVGFGQE